jgi:hypothetical protein
VPANASALALTRSCTPDHQENSTKQTREPMMGDPYRSAAVTHPVAAAE